MQPVALLLLLLLPFAAPYDSSEGPVVRVAQGELRGLRLQRSANAPLRTLYTFRGVPYARPPVGELRFKDPQEAESWTGIRNATAFGSNCIQKNLATQNVSGEEDCLYLNIFTADPPKMWSSIKRPVVVIIHGGAFVQWNGKMEFARPDPLLQEGLVLVGINYRLGVMGFLNTEDTQAPGNAGLKDQNMALRWVQRNIAAFGGDPNKVTILGESAGGASVQYHMLSPLSRGLFHRAISVSGSTLPSWARVQQPRRNALALRRRFAAACNDLAEDAIVACLQRIDANEFVFNQYEVPLQQYQDFFLKNTFLPAIEVASAGDAPFLTGDPEQLMKEGRFAQVPYMIGFTTAEGIVFLAFARLLEDPSRWAEVNEHFEDILRWELPPGLRTREAARQLRQFYLGNRTLLDASQNNDTLQRFVQLLTDTTIAAGSAKSAREMAARGASVYLYQFSRDGPIGFTKQAVNASYIPGVMHGDDMVYVYDFTDNPAVDADPLPIPASEQPIRERQAKIFANMAKTGNPTPEGSGLLHWPLFSSPKESFMDMDVELSVHHPALGRSNAFWRRLWAEHAVDSEPQTTTAR